jgi:thioredoxin-related protein
MDSKKKIDLIIILLGFTFILISVSSAFYIRNANIKKSVAANKDNAQEVSNRNKFLLTIETEYKSCGHVVKKTKLLRKNYDSTGELENDYKGYQAISLSIGKGEIYKAVEGYCPKHYIMKIIDGVVVIFYKEPQSDNKLIKEITDIKAKDLSYEDQEELKRGIEIYSDESLYQKLEEIGS